MYYSRGGRSPAGGGGGGGRGPAGEGDGDETNGLADGSAIIDLSDVLGSFYRDKF